MAKAINSKFFRSDFETFPCVDTLSEGVDPVIVPELNQAEFDEYTKLLGALKALLQDRIVPCAKHCATTTEDREFWEQFEAAE